MVQPASKWVTWDGTRYLLVPTGSGGGFYLFSASDVKRAMRKGKAFARMIAREVVQERRQAEQEAKRLDWIE